MAGGLARQRPTRPAEGLPQSGRHHGQCCVFDMESALMIQGARQRCRLAPNAVRIASFSSCPDYNHSASPSIFPSIVPIISGVVSNNTQVCGRLAGAVRRRTPRRGEVASGSCAPRDPTNLELTLRRCCAPSQIVDFVGGPR
jgi:hypothetical protein